MPQPPPPPPPTAGTDNKRLCDYCYTATAVLYCRADTAILCLSCDREVHSTNQLFSKHTRSQLCDSCDAAPASIFCETEQSVFCQNCDWEKHSVNGCLVHTRRPFEGFSGCPSVSELMGVLGVEDLGYYNSKKGLVCTEEGNDDWMDGYEDLLDWKTPAAVSIDDLMSGHESYDHGTLNFQSLGVPSLPKNRNAVCGQHKELVLLQLRELSRSELNTDIESDTVPSHMFHSLDAAQGLHPKYMDAVCGIPVTKEEENLLQWFPDPDDDSNQAFVASLLPDSDLGKSSTTPDKQSNVNGSTNQTVDVQGTELDHTVRVRSSSALPKISSHELNSQERDSAISRYKEKRKTRRYDKHIRYESRKVRAESRIRVRGRFAKMDH